MSLPLQRRIETLTNKSDASTTGIWIDTAAFGVPEEDRRSLRVSVRCLGNVKKPVRIDERGMFYLGAEAGNLTGNRLLQLVASVEERVIQLCRHKQAVPGRGTTRRARQHRGGGRSGGFLNSTARM